MSQLVLFHRCLLINFFCQHRSFLIVNITLFPSLLIIILPSLSPSHAFSLCLSLSFSVSLTTFTTISPFFYSSPYLSVFINRFLKVSLTISLRFYPYSPAFFLSLSVGFHLFPLCLPHSPSSNLTLFVSFFVPLPSICSLFTSVWLHHHLGGGRIWQEVSTSSLFSPLSCSWFIIHKIHISMT